ncbi:Alpha/Beta hydrolase protein [Mycena metata]|uniref:Carboxylic ester hydrolase n=1 Tax=Mycena metata TaxID=1033252 RepID=A0AAD7J4Y8_9AGAR|nr:Alpha/Beta hydrolase protein [Mycena metata]
MMLTNPNALYLLVGLASLTLAAVQQNLTVKTRTGTFIGNLNDTYPDVRQFKFIPYAKPPVGALRWTPPQPLDNSSEVIDSTTFGPSCSQYVSAVPTAWALNITGNLIVNYGESLLAGQVAQNSAEDCLTLAIWTPANATADSKLPVIHFLTGGGDVTGGINIPTQLPANWVHNSQAHIVVTTNYRVNIFSYPNARGLNGVTNFGLRDQRTAVEWIRENVASFGGDPSKITLWGQSAGASATDMYLFAYPEDPIIRASVSSSGEAIGRGQNPDIATGSNFTFVAKSLGCDFEDAALELQCMRRVPMPRIENFVGQYQDNSTLVVNSSQPAIAFTRAVDNVTVFANYTERYLNGQIAKLPKIIGTTAREASALDPYPINNVAAGPNETLVVVNTLATVCAAHNTTVLRNQIDLPTFRYEWGGNFSDLTGGVTWLGAYHYSDLYMLFGSYLINPLPPTDPLEANTSRVMQNFLLDFVKDPTSLPRSGWPEYQTGAENGGQIAQFGADGQAFKLVSGDSVEAACHIPGAVYNTTP